MEKRVFLVLLVVTLAAGGAFAQNMAMSAGGGATFAAAFTNVAWTSDGKDYLDKNDIAKDSMDVNYAGGGFFGFFDATYVMASLGLTFYNVSPANKDAREALKDAKITNSMSEFNIGVYGKYPFDMGKMVLFPILGADIKLTLARTTKIDGTNYEYNSSRGDGYGRAPLPISDLSAMWIKGGVGVDVPLSDKLYLRPIFMYGLGFRNNRQKYDDATINEDKNLMAYVNHGLDIKVAVGYKL